MKKIAILLIILGLVVMSLPIIGEIQRKLEEEALYRAYVLDLNELQKKLDENKKSNTLVVDTHSSYKEGDMIGRIVISKLDIDMPIQEGATKKVLKVGAGHMLGTAWPGERGNCALAGHRGGMAGKYFLRLDELQLGDEIIISFEKKVYSYKVIETKIVEPTDLTVLEQKEKESVLTLITCTPVGVGSHRLIVRAKQVEGR